MTFSALYLMLCVGIALLGLPGGTGSGSDAGVASQIAYGGSGGTGGFYGTGSTEGSGVGGSGQGNSSYMGCLALAQAHTLSAGQGGEGGTTSYDLGLMVLAVAEAACSSTEPVQRSQHRMACIATEPKAVPASALAEALADGLVLQAHLVVTVQVASSMWRPADVERKISLELLKNK